MDKNIVLLEGVIGDDFKYKKTVDGVEYATFTILMQMYSTATKEMENEKGRSNAQTMIRIFVYDKRLVEYLHKVDAKRGQRVSVFGRLSSVRMEYKGVSYIANNVSCRDITIIKTKKENQNGELQG